MFFDNLSFPRSVGRTCFLPPLFSQKTPKNNKIHLFWKTFNDLFGTPALAGVPKRRKKVHFCGQRFKGVSRILPKMVINDVCFF